MDSRFLLFFALVSLPYFCVAMEEYIAYEEGITEYEFSSSDDGETQSDDGYEQEVPSYDEVIEEATSFIDKMSTVNDEDLYKSINNLESYYYILLRNIGTDDESYSKIDSLLLRLREHYIARFFEVGYYENAQDLTVETEEVISYVGNWAITLTAKLACSVHNPTVQVKSCIKTLSLISNSFRSGRVNTPRANNRSRKKSGEALSCLDTLLDNLSKAWGEYVISLMETLPSAKEMPTTLEEVNDTLALLRYREDILVVINNEEDAFKLSYDVQEDCGDYIIEVIGLRIPLRKQLFEMVLSNASDKERVLSCIGQLNRWLREAVSCDAHLSYAEFKSCFELSDLMFDALESECNGYVEKETVTILHNRRDLLRTKWVLFILKKEEIDQEEAQSCLEQLQHCKTSLTDDLLQADELISQCEENVAQEQKEILDLLLKKEMYRGQFVEKQEAVVSFIQQMSKIKGLKKGECLEAKKRLLLDEHSVASTFVSQLSTLIEKIDTYYVKRQALLVKLIKAKLKKQKEKIPLTKRYQDNMMQIIQLKKVCDQSLTYDERKLAKQNGEFEEL